MRSSTLLCLFGPGELPVDLAEAMVDLVDAEVAMVRGTWGWALRARTDEVDDDLRKAFLKLAKKHSVDHAVVTGPLATRPPQLIVLDVDSTLTTTEAIDLLADEAGSGPEVAEATERAMRGELDFRQALDARVATLTGLDGDAIERARAHVTLQPGADDLARRATILEIPIALVSGGFVQFVQPLAEALPATFWAANTLETDAEGRLTGRVLDPIVDRTAKERLMLEYAAHLGIEPALVLAVGDGANDLDMLATAGLGVAYCAKPVTAAQADVAISFPRLDAIWALVTTPDELSPGDDAHHD
ncbi:phosphoserine phosphatase SerB [Aestuariimicrobium ganziense]|uniref:phosphoserine phosphatase SerB n=1 Tax=Aestuariimicrobium ganziense TaxID=2773677 RepID=UPI0019416A0E|nr:phosphoserine phosphatase SerB [Aestuariimicrobium ganziense]